MVVALLQLLLVIRIAAVDSLSHISTPITWLHVPKTGSTFGNTVYRMACFNISDDAEVGCAAPIHNLTHRFPTAEHCVGGFVDNHRVNYHQPLRWSVDAGRVVTILRNPLSLKESFLAYAQKLVVRAEEERARCGVQFDGLLGSSGFHGNLEGLRTAFASLLHENISLPGRGGGANGSMAEEEEDDDDRKTKNHAAMELLMPLTARLQGCQVKMVLGKKCLWSSEGSGRPFLREQHVVKAVHRLKQFAFVGIFERWEDSIELLHERLESPFPILPQEIIARRKTDPHKKQRFEALLQRAGPDRADRALYEAATVRFEGELELLRLEGASGRGDGEAAVVE